jgi:hypothetical protein
MQKALIESQREQASLISYLVKNKIAKASQVAWLMADEFGDPLFDLDALDFDLIPKNTLTKKSLSNTTHYLFSSEANVFLLPWATQRALMLLMPFVSIQD